MEGQPPAEQQQQQQHLYPPKRQLRHTQHPTTRCRIGKQSAGAGRGQFTLTCGTVSHGYVNTLDSFWIHCIHVSYVSVYLYLICIYVSRRIDTRIHVLWMCIRDVSWVRPTIHPKYIQAAVRHIQLTVNIHDTWSTTQHSRCTHDTLPIHPWYNNAIHCPRYVPDTYAIHKYRGPCHPALPAKLCWQWGAGVHI